MTSVSASSPKWLRYLAACGLLVAAACAPAPAPAQTAGAVSAVAPSVARIWFYRDGSPSDGLGVTEISLNGSPVGQAQINSSFYRDVPPGAYHISLSNPVPDIAQSADINLAPGQVAYIKIATLDNWDSSSSSNRGGGAHTTFYIWPMPPATGIADIGRIPYRGG
jgi:hypothetical protein